MHLAQGSGVVEVRLTRRNLEQLLDPATPDNSIHKHGAGWTLIVTATDLGKEDTRETES